MASSREDGLTPYNFEPQMSERELEELEAASDSDSSSGPASVEDFCSCENCEIMPNKIENICCNGSDLTVSNLGDKQCITDDPYFEMVVLNRPVLEVAFIQIMAFKGLTGRAPEELTNT